jgi:hypothetical protein
MRKLTREICRRLVLHTSGCDRRTMPHILRICYAYFTQEIYFRLVLHTCGSDRRTDTRVGHPGTYVPANFKNIVFGAYLAQRSVHLRSELFVCRTNLFGSCTLLKGYLHTQSDIFLCRARHCAKLEPICMSLRVAQLKVT